VFWWKSRKERDRQEDLDMGGMIILKRFLGLDSSGTGWKRWRAMSSTSTIEILPEKKVVGLERGPLSLVSTTEELLDRKVLAPV
jgi:hypothetical protein